MDVINLSKLLKDNSKLMKEYNYEKNENIDLNNLTLGSDAKVWWICDKKHEWTARIGHRSKGSNCPYCSNQKVLKGYNDLETTNPLLAKEWNYKKNNPLKPSDIIAGTNKKFWWICEKGHEWQQSSNARTKGNGCPYCASRKLLIGYNDLSTTNPLLAKEWNYKKNKFGPETVMEHSNKKVWWICEKGHEWEATINSRSSGVNCSICSKELKTSFPEKTIYFYVKKIFKDAIENYREETIKNKEIDIYIPSEKIGIEYDGDYWHHDERDIEKDLLCKNNGIHLFRIREPKCGTLKTSTCIKLKNRTLMELESKIKYLLNNLLGKTVDINIERDKNQIYELMDYQEKQNSLSIKSPQLVEEWDYEKNHPLLPSQVSFGSNKKVWWLCSKCGHSWETKIAHRFNGSGCPLCLPYCKEIEQYDLKMNLLKIYKSIANAERETGIQHIKDALSGARKTAGGYIWKYKEDINELRNN